MAGMTSSVRPSLQWACMTSRGSDKLIDTGATNMGASLSDTLSIPCYVTNSIRLHHFIAYAVDWWRKRMLCKYSRWYRGKQHSMRLS